MPTDGNIAQFPARKPHLRVVEQSPAGRHDFTPRQPSFRPAEALGAVYWETVRLSPETVEHLLADFQREAGRTGDWTLHDDLLTARDGIWEPPLPPAA